MTVLHCLLLAALFAEISSAHPLDGRLARVEMSSPSAAVYDEMLARGCEFRGVGWKSRYIFSCDAFPAFIEAHDDVTSVSAVDVLLHPDISSNIPDPRPIGHVPIHSNLELELRGAYHPKDLEAIEHFTLVYRVNMDPAAKAEAVADVAHHLRFIARPMFAVFHGSSLLVGLPPATPPRLVGQALSAMKNVVEVTRPQHGTFENAYAARNIQGKTMADQMDLTSVATTPLHDLGIKGKDVVVGCGDSGVDVNHCFFYDAVNTFSFDTMMADHRKFVKYDTRKDNKDPVEGHGTHVVGTIAGSPVAVGPGSQYSGVAPESRVFFMDLGINAVHNAIYAPSNLYFEYFLPAAHAGATVHSSSWGSNSPHISMSTTSDEYTDLSAWHVRNLTILVSAGNENTVLGPACTHKVSKNSIAVGASMAGTTANKNLFCDSTNATRWVPSAMSNDYVSTACSYSSSSSLPYGEANSMAIFSSMGPTPAGQIKPEIVTDGSWLISAKGNERATGDTTCDLDTDFVAFQGTSMATPAAAGGVALLQQFLKEGFHIDGGSRPADGFMPSSAMVRALAIATAQDMDGKIAFRMQNGTLSWVNPPPAPNGASGWGRFALGNLLEHSLLLRDESDLPALTVAEPRRGFTFTVNSANADLSVALSWIDPPRMAEDARRHSVMIVNFLNLWVVAPDGTTYTGNHDGPATRDNVDLYNVNQRIRIPKADVQAGTYTIYVDTSMPMDFHEQPYALAIWGDVDNSALTAAPGFVGVCPGGCGTGSCTATGCSCPAGKSGWACSYDIVTLTDAGVSVALPPGGSTVVLLDPAVHNTTELVLDATNVPYCEDCDTREANGAPVDLIVMDDFQVVDATAPLVSFGPNGVHKRTIGCHYDTKAYVLLKTHKGWNTIKLDINVPETVHTTTEASWALKFAMAVLGAAIVAIVALIASTLCVVLSYIALGKVRAVLAQRAAAKTRQPDAEAIYPQV